MATDIPKIKVAVVGGGAFGEEHLRTFASMPHIEIGGVYTLDNTRGEELCARYGGRNYPILQALAEDESVELVSIATPENQHLEPFNVLSQSGKAIYVEKPLASSLAEARKMLELSKSILAMSGHCLRFEQRLATVFERLRGVPKYHFQSRNRRTRVEKETYGRVHPAYSMLCHEIELSNAFAESTFKRVIALETKYSEGQVDGMSILIEYENGMTSSVEGGWYLPAQNSCIENDFISVLSANGVDELSMPHLGFYNIDHEGLKTPNLYYGYSVYGTEYGPLRAAFDYFVNCLQQNKTPEISTIQDAYNAVEVIEAALKSVPENRWISRDEIVGKKL
jgi:UDP-N-acetylglucosamine 3-dehydrogenase